MNTDVGDSSDQHMTAAQLSREIQAELERVGVDDASYSARLLVEDGTGIGWSESEWRTEPLTARMVAAVDRSVERRAGGEPLQYVLGSWPFRSVDLLVDKRALIPRPETEVVAGLGIAALQRLKARRLTVADLGTGSGAIALSVAVEVPRAEVMATDISTPALELLRANLAGIGMAGSRVTTSEGRWFDALPVSRRGDFDLIISNPPYIGRSEVLDSSVTDWEPTEALFADDDGLRDVSILISEARDWLRPGGTLVLEIGTAQGSATLDLAVRAGYSKPSIERDLSGHDRALLATWSAEFPPETEVASLVERLRRGETLVTPTDTVAGVIADANNPEAVQAVLDVKQRPGTAPLPVFVAHIDQARTLGVFPDLLDPLLARFWPGALTVVVDRLGPPDPISGHATVGLRCPDDSLLRSLAAHVGPLTGTSANLHGEPTPDNSADAGELLGLPRTNIVDGQSTGSLPSTIVRIANDRVEILRQGPIVATDIESHMPPGWTIVDLST
jgi:release factor glutamine methyltransferase